MLEQREAQANGQARISLAGGANVPLATCIFEACRLVQHKSKGEPDYWTLVHTAPTVE
jgi:hypothetical protein